MHIVQLQERIRHGLKTTFINITKPTQLACRPGCYHLRSLRRPRGREHLRPLRAWAWPRCQVWPHDGAGTDRVQSKCQTQCYCRILSCFQRKPIASEPEAVQNSVITLSLGDRRRGGAFWQRSSLIQEETTILNLFQVMAFETMLKTHFAVGYAAQHGTRQSPC